MVTFKNYFRKLDGILKEQTTLYFGVLIVSGIFILRMAIAAFCTASGVRIDWVAFGCIALFVLSCVLQSLLLQKKCYPLFLVRVLMVSLLVFQIGYRVYNIPSHSLQTMGNPYLESDDCLGFRVIPNLHDVWRWQIVSKDTLYKVCYSTDNFSRRVPDDAFIKEHSKDKNHPDKHALFFGCSFTFGHGVMYSSTFPYLFETLNPDYKSYNYGMSGYGPHQIALLFDKRVNTINNEAIPEEKGFALYTYMDDHLNRVYGGSDYCRWVHSLPPNVYIENDSLVKKEWPQTRLLCYRFLYDINLFVNFKFTMDYPKKDSFYKRFAAIINYAAKKYWELYPENHFFVGIYPGYDTDLNWTQYLDEKIVALRMDTPPDYNDKSKYEVSRFDHHPSVASNSYYAEELTKLINEYEM